MIKRIFNKKNNANSTATSTTTTGNTNSSQQAIDNSNNQNVTVNSEPIIKNLSRSFELDDSPLPLNITKTKDETNGSYFHLFVIII